MPTTETLDERLRAVERAVTDADADLTPLRDAAELDVRVRAHGERLDALEARVEELEAATQALRGYVGSVRSVNDGVERRADAALAKAESLEAEIASADVEQFETDSLRPDSEFGVPHRGESERDSDSGGETDDAEDSTRGLLARLAGVS